LTPHALHKVFGPEHANAKRFTVLSWNKLYVVDCYRVGLLATEESEKHHIDNMTTGAGADLMGHYPK
jgi:hypothetical protein